MIERDTKLQITDEPAIAYSTCYRLPFLSLFHADCMEIMKQYPDKYFDLAIVDPPYGINGGVDNRNAIETKSGNNLRRFARKGGMNWDRETPPKEYFDELRRVSKNQIIWGGNYFINYLENTRCLICWNKMTYIPSMSQMEVAWTSFDRHTKYIKINSNQSDRIHISQKPIDLYDWTIRNFATEGMKILDTHFGSGSIALAVDKANRLDKMNLHLTACEIDKEYIDKAIKRITESIKQGTLSF
jgi:site-specific DNA-methyltransferase (adenine-specific)